MRRASDAHSAPNVLSQLDSDRTSRRFAIAIANDVERADARVAVRCRSVSGQVDQACGIVFRYQDADNYYVTRANALEGNIRLYVVKAGKRQQIASYDGEVAAGVWHDYEVEVKGPRIEVYWNGKQVLAVDDGTFAGAGRIGLWTKADSVSDFDDLTVTPR